MAQLVQAAPDRLATHFIDYLFEEYQGSRHVRRVGAWIGFIIMGVRRLGVSAWRVPRKRQLVFEHAGRQYKVKYNHLAGRRGGVDIVEILSGRGAPEGQTITSITSLREAERFYRACSKKKWP